MTNSIHRARRVALPVVLLALSGFPALAQTASSPGEPLDGAGAAHQFDALTRRASDRIHAALLIDERDEDARLPLLVEAEQLARAAIELSPENPQGWFLAAAALGLRSQYVSMRQQMRMAREIWSMSAAALERDSMHAGAHHVLGRLNLKAMGLSSVARIFARHFFSAEVLQLATWEQAETHLVRAVELEPSLHHRLWLARFYSDHGEDARARPILEAILASPARTPLDRVWQREAAEDLEEL